MSPESALLSQFKDKLRDFATGQQRGIRNPFVVVPVLPKLEWKITRRMEAWAEEEHDEVHVVTVRLDRLMPGTPVFETVGALPVDAYPDRSSDPTTIAEETLRENLARELIELLLTHHPEVRQPDRPLILLLLNLGALYPFARASRLLDELDRRGVRATVGVPFPGEMVAGGKMSFFGEEATHYYPAHQIEGQLGEAELQR